MIKMLSVTRNINQGKHSQDFPLLTLKLISLLKELTQETFKEIFLRHVINFMNWILC